MNKLTTPLILSSIYFLLITPLGLIMRIFGKDPLNMKLQPMTDSYRQFSGESDELSSVCESMEKPF